MLQTIDIKRADILWLKLPQTLAPMDVALSQPYKIRPFIVLNDSLPLKIDHNRECTQVRPILGVDCTSKPYLVEGRPHIKFSMPGRNGTTDSYALLDSVRDINSFEQKIRISHRLADTEEKALIEGLGNVLKPEQRFYLTGLFNKKSMCMPGQIWRVKTINADGEALVLLRRGRFVSSADIEDSAQIDPPTQQMKSAPYLVAYFTRATNVKTLRGLTWDDIQIMAMKDSAFQYKTAELTPETSGILLNNIRERAGLPAIEYKQPLFKNLLNPLTLLRTFAMPGMR